MVTNESIRANAILQEARDKFYNHPNEVNVIQARSLLNALMNVVDKRVHVMLPDKEYLDNETITVRFTGKTVKWDEDDYLFEINEVDTSEEDGYKYQMHDPTETIVIEQRLLHDLNATILTEHVVKELGTYSDENGKKIFDVSFESSNEKRNCEFSITLNVTHEQNSFLGYK